MDPLCPLPKSATPQELIAPSHKFMATQKTIAEPSAKAATTEPPAKEATTEPPAKRIKPNDDNPHNDNSKAAAPIVIDLTKPCVPRCSEPWDGKCPDCEEARLRELKLWYQSHVARTG